MNPILVFKPLKLGASVSTGLLLLRIVAGLAFMFHGYSKIQSPFSWMGPEAGVPGFLQMLAAVFGGYVMHRAQATQARSSIWSVLSIYASMLGMLTIGGGLIWSNLTSN